MRITIETDDGKVLEALYAPDEVKKNTWQRICTVLRDSQYIHVFLDEIDYIEASRLQAQYNEV